MPDLKKTMQDSPNKPTEPKTIRQEILELLRKGSFTTHDLSGILHIREKDVIPHLEHLQRSLKGSIKRFVMEPAECISCGFVFENRSRLSKPSACPKCRKQRVEPPVFHVADK